MRGFSLVELILVIALFTIIALFAYPMSLALFNTQILEESRNGVEVALRNAYTRSITEKNDTSHGVKILENSLVLFEGNSYDTREVSKDHVVALPETLIHAGFDEIIFEQFSGRPSATGTLRLQYAGEETLIYINEIGVIE